MGSNSTSEHARDMVVVATPMFWGIGNHFRRLQSSVRNLYASRPLIWDLQILTHLKLVIFQVFWVLFIAMRSLKIVSLHFSFTSFANDSFSMLFTSSRLIFILKEARSLSTSSHQSFFNGDSTWANKIFFISSLASWDTLYFRNMICLHWIMYSNGIMECSTSMPYFSEFRIPMKLEALKSTNCTHLKFLNTCFWWTPFIINPPWFRVREPTLVSPLIQYFRSHCLYVYQKSFQTFRNNKSFYEILVFFRKNVSEYKIGVTLGCLSFCLGRGSLDFRKDDK